ncbi:MAG: hypothetical protein WAS33_16525 [Candidatus Promineifilaceae bacterium]|nr:hypothetical protein [Flavobacteriales bacterium]
MSAIDDPKRWILKLFAMEIRERGDANAQRFEQGIRSPEEAERSPWKRLFRKRTQALQLVPEERVFGVYKKQYYFTPLAFIQRKGDAFERIRWDEIVHCSSTHPLGVTEAILTLSDGRRITVKVGDLGKGWVGRISQLFHQLIEHHGAKAALGEAPMSIKEFFEKAQDDYSFLPNLEPHPSLAEARSALEALLHLPGVDDIRLVLDENAEEGPISQGVLVRGTVDPALLSEFVEQYGADGMIDASDEIRRHFRDMKPGEQLLHIVWD